MGRHRPACFHAPPVLVAVAAATGCGAVLLQPPPQKPPPHHGAHAGGKKSAGSQEPLGVNKTMARYLSDCQCAWARQLGSCDTDDTSHCWGVCCHLGKRSNCRCAWARKAHACDGHSRDGSQCWKECCNTIRYGIIQAEILNHKQGMPAAADNASQAIAAADAPQEASVPHYTAAAYAPQARPSASNLGNMTTGTAGGTQAAESAAEIMDEYTLAGEKSAPKITGDVSAVNDTHGSISGSDYIFGNASRNSTSIAGRASGSHHVAGVAPGAASRGNTSSSAMEGAAAIAAGSAAEANISSGVNVMTPKSTVWEDQN